MRLQRISGGYAMIPAISALGRDPRSDVCLREACASLRHAEIRARPNGWEVRDLGSRNGTALNGIRLAPGLPTALHEDTVLQFGGPAEQWRVVDADPPAAALYDPDTGEHTAALDGEMGPLAYDLDLDAWSLDGRAIGHGERIGERVAFIPSRDHAATTIPSLVAFDAARLRLFASRDLERISMRLVCGDAEIEIGEHTWGLPLYVLAMERITRVGDAEGDGWIEVDRLARLAGLDRKTLDVDLLRARETFVRAGVASGDRIVEVRPGARRLGTADVDVVRESA